MMIFIPILIICLNGNCEFMQGQTYYKNEDQCIASMNMQKQHMLDLIKQADQGAAQVLEGTCVDVNIKIISGRTA
jgi:hypothetical protein